MASPRLASVGGAGAERGSRPARANESEGKQRILIPAVSPSARPVLRGLKPLPEELLTVAEAAATLKVCRATVYALCAQGALAHVRVSNAIRIQKAALELFIAGRTP